MAVFYEFDDVDAFTIGTEGRPGERTFYLQARANGQRVTLKCEKQQAAAIVQYLRRVLSDNKARLVYGPTATDAYLLAVPAGLEATAVRQLRQEDAVLLVESLDGRAAP